MSIKSINCKRGEIIVIKIGQWIVCFFCFSTPCFGQLHLDISLDANGFYKIANKPQDFYSHGEIEPGVSLFGDYSISLNRTISIGAGIGFVTPRSAGGFQGDVYDANPEFFLVPVYLTMKANLNDQDIKPFVSGRIGYNYLNGQEKLKYYITKPDGTFFYDIGWGIQYQKFTYRISYAVHNGTINVKYLDEYKARYTNLGFAFGYDF